MTAVYFEKLIVMSFFIKHVSPQILGFASFCMKP